MAVTSYIFAGTTTNADRNSSVSWASTDNAKVDDSNFASSNPDKDAYSDWLRVTNFSMGVPAGATIDGIEVVINRAHATGAMAVDSAVYIRKTSGQVGTNFASATAWPTKTPEKETYGGASELWGTTWSEADVNTSDFGLDISVLGDGDNAAGHVYYIKIRVHYTAGAGGTNMKINIGDTFKDVDSMKINIGDSWKSVESVKINVGDVWKTVF